MMERIWWYIKAWLIILTVDIVKRLLCRYMGHHLVEVERWDEETYHLFSDVACDRCWFPVDKIKNDILKKGRRIE